MGTWLGIGGRGRRGGPAEGTGSQEFGICLSRACHGSAILSPRCVTARDASDLLQFQLLLTCLHACCWSGSTPTSPTYAAASTHACAGRLAARPRGHSNRLVCRRLHRRTWRHRPCSARARSSSMRSTVSRIARLRGLRLPQMQHLCPASSSSLYSRCTSASTPLGNGRMGSPVTARAQRQPRAPPCRCCHLGLGRLVAGRIRKTRHL